VQTVSVSELESGLSGYLDSVKAGEEVVVTEDGRPIARVVPVRQSGLTEAELEEMERAGLIRRPTGTLPPDFWDRPRVEDPEGIALKGLLKEREEGW
jgi:prevent-host-death family protein